MLSICTTIKNRSRLRVGEWELDLFPNCVRSLVESIGRDVECELVVTDWQSDDWPLGQWLEEAARPIPARIVTLDGNFSRGRGLNVAASAARGKSLFFMDADVLVCSQVFRRGIQCVEQQQGYFPVLYSFNDPEHRTGRWRRRGFGHCMISKRAFEEVGGWPEYESWGKEDDHFYENVQKLMPVVREDVNGFFHQWHPDDLDFKNQYGKETELFKRSRHRRQEGERAARAMERLAGVLPHDACYILVDESLFTANGGDKDHVFPFLERDGEYWGPPMDDGQAIQELERLRRQQASFIVFAWPAFWWMEHYKVFAEYLQSTYPRVLHNENLIVFDLRRSAVLVTDNSTSVCAPVTVQDRNVDSTPGFRES